MGMFSKLFGAEKEKCQNHPQKNAISVCVSCKRHFCADCLTEVMDYYLCESEICKNFIKENKIKETLETQYIPVNQTMTGVRNLKDIVTGKIFKSNRLIQNHAVRFCEKIQNSDDKILWALVVQSSASTTYFLEVFLLEAPDFKYNDGTVEPNPFKKNLYRLDESKSCLIFKWVAGLYFSGMLAKNLLDQVPIKIEKLQNDFFEVYEYDDEDIHIFFELKELWPNIDKKEGVYPQIKLYDYIFEKAYTMRPPDSVYHMQYFTLAFLKFFKESFLSGFLEALNV